MKNVTEPCTLSNFQAILKSQASIKQQISYECIQKLQWIRFTVIKNQRTHWVSFSDSGFS